MKLEILETPKFNPSFDYRKWGEGCSFQWADDFQCVFERL